jgi:ASC-1-like (ASCH) protein
MQHMKNWTVRFREVDRKNFEEVRSGAKSIETRAATVKYRPIEVGDTLTFACGKDRFAKTITKRYHWPSIDAMVGEVPFQKIMPSVASVEDMKKVYASYPGYEEKIAEHGLLGFELK